MDLSNIDRRYLIEKDRNHVISITDQIADILVELRTSGVEFKNLTLDKVSFSGEISGIILILLSLVCTGCLPPYIGFVLNYELIKRAKHCDDIQLFDLYYTVQLLQCFTTYGGPDVGLFLEVADQVYPKEFYSDLEERIVKYYPQVNI